MDDLASSAGGSSHDDFRDLSLDTIESCVSKLFERVVLRRPSRDDPYDLILQATHLLEVAKTRKLHFDCRFVDLVQKVEHILSTSFSSALSLISLEEPCISLEERIRALRAYDPTSDEFEAQVASFLRLQSATVQQLVRSLKPEVGVLASRERTSAAVSMCRGRRRFRRSSGHASRVEEVVEPLGSPGLICAAETAR